MILLLRLEFLSVLLLRLHKAAQLGERNLKAGSGVRDSPPWVCFRSLAAFSKPAQAHLLLRKAWPLTMRVDDGGGLNGTVSDEACGLQFPGCHSQHPLPQGPYIYVQERGSLGKEITKNWPCHHSLWALGEPLVVMVASTQGLL